MDNILLEATYIDVIQRPIICITFSNLFGDNKYLFGLYSKDKKAFPFITVWDKDEVTKIVITRTHFVFANTKITYSIEAAREIWDGLTDGGFVVEDMMEESFKLNMNEKDLFKMKFGLMRPSELTIL